MLSADTVSSPFGSRCCEEVGKAVERGHAAADRLEGVGAQVLSIDRATGSWHSSPDPWQFTGATESSANTAQQNAPPTCPAVALGYLSPDEYEATAPQEQPGVDYDSSSSEQIRHYQTTAGCLI